MFLRPASYFKNRFYYKQETAWLAYKAGKTIVLPCGRRSGKSLAYGTKIPTTNGLKQIKDIIPGDYVFSKEGRPIRVKALMDKGQCEVFDLCNNGRVLVTATVEHRWLSYDPRKESESVRTTGDLTKYIGIASRYYDFEVGAVDEPHAYAIGALIGNGCCNERGNLLYISHGDELVPAKVAYILGLPHKKNRGVNHTWAIGVPHEKPQCNWYNEWLKNKKSHTKSVDLGTIKSWNRRSLLSFVAGLLDTDGSVLFTGKEIQIRWDMQAKSGIEALQYALLALWQYEKEIYVDNRQKYKNGPVLQVGIKHIWHCKRILKELDPYLVNPKRKYRSEYDALESNNFNPKFVGVSLKNPRIEHCYDIEVDSEDRLFLLANGMVSHNSEFFCETLVEDVEEYGLPNLYLASTQESAREIMWPKMRARVQGLQDWKLNDSVLEALYKPTHTPIRFRGIEKVDNLAGKAYHLVIADEFALWKKDPKTIVKQILAPMIADFDGLLMYGSSKRGKNHLYDIHQQALSDPAKFYYEEWTIFDNPFVSESGRQKLISEYDGEDDPLYRQEVLNEYITFAGMVFALDINMYTCPKWDAYEFDHAIHWRGVDHGFSPDPTAALWMAYSFKRKQFIIYNEYKQARLLINQHAEVINGMERYDFRDTISDVDPQVIAEYDAVGLTMTPASKYDKQARLLRLVNALRTGKVKISHDCVQLLKEMASYEWEQDGNDHLIDAFIYVFTNTEVPVEPAKPEPWEPKRTRVEEGLGQDFEG